MPLTTAYIGIQLLMDSMVSLQEFEARLSARVFAAVQHPERGPAVRAVLAQLLAVLDATSSDGGDLKSLVASLPWSGAPAGCSPGGWGLGGIGAELAKGVPPRPVEPITSLNDWCQLRWPPIGALGHGGGASWLSFIVLGGKQWLLVKIQSRAR
jgi:hypothetical protein